MTDDAVNPGAPSAGWKAVQSPRRRLLIALAALGAMLLFVAPYFFDPLDTSVPSARAGLIDFSNSGPLDRPVPLRGQARFVWLAGAGPAPGTTAILDLPGQWSGHTVGGKVLPELGRARYELVLRGLEKGRYTIHIPSMFSASRVTIDGQVESQRGTLADSPQGARYFVRAQNVGFESDGSDVRLELEMASWLHRDNGVDEAPALGRAATMEDWFAIRWSREILYNVSLILTASLALVGFLYRTSDRASLYLGLACVAFLPSVTVLGFDNLLLAQFPGLEFRSMLLLQYMSANLAIVLFFANAHALYPAECPRSLMIVVTGAFGAVALTQAALIAMGDTVTASRLGGYVFIPLAVATLIVMLIIVGIATARQRDGAFIYLLGMLLFVASFIALAIVWAGWLPSNRVAGSEFTTLGAIMILYSQVVLMAERWSLSVGRSEQVTGNLRELLDVNTAIASELDLKSLLKRIVGASSRIIHADRSSLFLQDKDNPVLASMVAQGVENTQISFDSGRGLAGYVHATGQTVNVPDAYADERFNRSIDEATGYRTRSVLTVPITARDGRRIGVMQALNRTDGRPFDSEDAEQLAAFGSQAAVAIENARLFGEAISARNFDESILRSMAGGVIALDREWKITKLNDAAAEILGAPSRLLVGLEIKTLLGQHNPWLVDEVGAVAAAGEAKLILDLELVTARDRTSSVNISIAPLQGERGQVGVLLVIEDISEEKRLQGAMRRFMTQKVVDQVLGREDELLFGTACEASVLFADIRGFTTLAENLSARDTVETLNELFTELFEAVAGHEGVLDKYIGDAIMAVYGAPLPTGQDAANAMASGVEMLRLLDKVNDARAGRGLAPLRLGIGISTGEVVAGTIGSPKRMDYTVIGDSVNLAARLQDLTKVYGIEMLVCETTARSVAHSHDMREIDLIAVRGRQRPETVFEVLARPPADPARRAALLKAYAAGRAALARGEWEAALAAFADALGHDPDDRPSWLMLERTRVLADKLLGDHWDGVWRDHPSLAGT